MLPQTVVNHGQTGSSFIVLSAVESTNNYAMAKLHDGLVPNGCCILALEQTAGRGRRGNRWLSGPGENITMSTVLQAGQAQPFVFSASMALGCYDFIKMAGIENLSIKWPNDLYVGDRKAAGILIENTYRGSSWEWSVVGTGINLNQLDFPGLGDRPVSLREVTGRSYDVIRMSRQLHRSLLARYEQLNRAAVPEIIDEYNSRLYGRGRMFTLKKGSIVFRTRIERVTATGELVTTDAIERNFSVNEVEWIGPADSTGG